MAPIKKQGKLKELSGESSTAIITEKNEGFKFEEGKHRYTLDGKPLTGVTTILQVIAKPALIQWSADMACGFIRDWAEKNTGASGDTPFDELILALAEARLAHRKRKEAAGDIGTDAHKEIEYLVIDAIKNNDGLTRLIPNNNDNGQVRKMVDNFLTWATENKVKFLESEKRLYSKEHWYAGTVDLVFEMDGKRYIGDVKTSSAIYNEHFYQMAAYDICLQEMGQEKVDGYIVINLKKDGTMDLKMAQNVEINKQAFLHALGLYRIINSLE